MKRLRKVLIETYWNVKKNRQNRKDGPVLGINRNILECKGCILSSIDLMLVGINRNILECKGR